VLSRQLAHVDVDTLLPTHSLCHSPSQQGPVPNALSKMAPSQGKLLQLAMCIVQQKKTVGAYRTFLAACHGRIGQTPERATVLVLVLHY
jgi:hypothetical protein